ncbi:MAG: tetratricopeptide repeat protein [Magnetococcales bacterium]|nr:tetratricopeptide repeat protein [Magnetococcales bacterium]
MHDITPSAQTTAAWLKNAIALHQADDIAGAEEGYRQVLLYAPDQPDAHHNLGILLLGRGEIAPGIEHLQTALMHNPGNLHYWLSLIDALLANGFADAALEVLNQGSDQGIGGEPLLERYHALIAHWHRAGHLPQAQAVCRKVALLWPDDPRCHYDLGVLSAALGHLHEAETAYRRAVAIKPDFVAAWSNLGVVLANQGRPGEAEVAYRQALRLSPDHVEAHNNLAVLLARLRRFTEAEAVYREIPRLLPNAEALCNLAIFLKERNLPEEAEATFLEALRLDPEWIEAQWSLSHLYLAQGRFAEGWPLYETRFHPRKRERNVHPPDLPFPRWQGEDLTGRSLVILPEQGIGDQLQFCRYAELLKTRGARWITLVCDASLQALFATLTAADLVTPPDEPLAMHDFWTFPMSCPLHCKTTLATIPARIPYLRPLPERLRAWSATGQLAGLRVGLAWKGSAMNSNDAARSLPGLATLAPLWSVPGVTFVSLQKGSGEEEARHPPAGQPLVNLAAGIREWADTAAVVAQLDLVIAIDSAIVHLAGALGRECWVLLPAWGTDWRWLREREDSPWYPQRLRLFRQDASEGWPEVVARVTAALRPWRTGLAVDQYHLALDLEESGQLAAAEAAYREALRLQPDLAPACNNLGNLYRALSRHAEAEACYRQAMRACPDCFDAFNNLGNLCKDQRRHAEAEAAYREGLRIRPESLELCNNLGNLHEERGDLAQAETCYREALRVAPGNPDAAWNLGLLLLSLGRFQEGWPLHEARLHPDKRGWRIRLPELPCPRWRGESLQNRTLLVLQEQGSGDVLQFCRFLPLLKARGAGRLILACQPELSHLMRTLAGVERVVTPDEGDGPPQADFWTPILSIPWLLQIDAQGIPGALPYLHAPRERLAHWQGHPFPPGLRVGLVWQGNPAHENDRNRSLPGLAVLAPLWGVPGMVFVSLQKGAGAHEAHSPPPGQPLLDMGGRLHDFAETAALIQQLDLVIGVDSAVIHLAGALGKRCWLMLPWRADWRWLRDRTDSPWYPGVMRLFRQSSPGDWSDVVARMAKEAIPLAWHSHG